MDPDEIMLNTEESMEKAFDYLQHEFAAVRTGKARLGWWKTSMWKRTDR
jgi:ribosome recycling factor